MDKTSKIYVTGHTGMLGSAMMARLQSDGYINIITRTHKELDLTRQSDVEAFFETEHPEYVFHIAAKTGGVMLNKTYPVEYLAEGTLIALNVLNAANTYGAKGVVYVASANIYPEEAPQPMSEELFLTGRQPFFWGGYALAKSVGIKFCECIHRQHGKQFVSAVLPAVYGLNDYGTTVMPMLLDKFADAVITEKPDVTIWGTGNVYREFINSKMVLSPLDGPLKDIYESAGISVVIKEMEQDSKVDLVKYNAYLADLIKYLEKEKIDLIYSNTIETFWGIDLAARLDVPAIWGIHESIDVKRYFADNYPQEISQVAINQFSYASKVAFVAETTKQMYHCVDAMNLVVIKNGIDLKRIQEYRRTHEKSTLRNLAGIKEDEILVSIFGTVCFRKGQRVFIEAARDLSKDKNRKLLFYIVGAKQSTYLNDLKRYIEENGLEEKVKIIEVCDDIYQYYMMSDYFVCASYEESSPQVVLEAMAFELPIVSTNVFGIPEQIRNECEALLVEPGNPIAIADALRRLMDDANLSDKLTQNGIYRLKSKFTYEMMLKNYDYLFQEACQEGSRTELVKYWSVKK